MSKVLQIFKDEFKLAMGLTGKMTYNVTKKTAQIIVLYSAIIVYEHFLSLGCCSVEDISQDMVTHEALYSKL